MKAPATILSGLALAAVIVLGLTLTTQISSLQSQLREINRPANALAPNPELAGIRDIQATVADIRSQLNSIGTTVSGLEAGVADADNSGVADELSSLNAAISDIQFGVDNVCDAVNC